MNRYILSLLIGVSFLPMKEAYAMGNTPEEKGNVSAKVPVRHASADKMEKPAEGVDVPRALPSSLGSNDVQSASFASTGAAAGAPPSSFAAETMSHSDNSLPAAAAASATPAWARVVGILPAPSFAGITTSNLDDTTLAVAVANGFTNWLKTKGVSSLILKDETSSGL